MYTANTMSSAFEAMGMSLPYSSTMANEDGEKTQSAAESAAVLVEAIKKGIKPRDIITKKSIENAVTVIMATGGSTNASCTSWPLLMRPKWTGPLTTSSAFVVACPCSVTSSHRAST